MLNRNLRTSILFLAVSHLACAHAHPKESTESPLTAAALSQHPVVGRLGLALGTPTEIEAIVIAGSELRVKEYDGSYLLRVTKVDGRLLAEPPLMRFAVRGFAEVQLANDPFHLYELKMKGKAEQLSSEQIGKLEEGYVGKQVRVVAYEEGGYSGIPHHLPKDVPIWADRSFAFRTWLIVLAERN
jgi:hypothetical protein